MSRLARRGARLPMDWSHLHAAVVYAGASCACARRCECTSRSGRRCKRCCLAGSRFCKAHQRCDKVSIAVAEAPAAAEALAGDHQRLRRVAELLRATHHRVADDVVLEFVHKLIASDVGDSTYDDRVDLLVELLRATHHRVADDVVLEFVHKLIQSDVGDSTYDDRVDLLVSVGNAPRDRATMWSMQWILTSTPKEWRDMLSLEDETLHIRKRDDPADKMKKLHAASLIQSGGRNVLENALVKDVFQTPGRKVRPALAKLFRAHSAAASDP